MFNGCSKLCELAKKKWTLRKPKHRYTSMRASLNCYKIPDTYWKTATIWARPFISLFLSLSVLICPPLSADPKCPADVDFNSTDMDIKTITSALKFYLRWVKHIISFIQFNYFMFSNYFLVIWFNVCLCTGHLHLFFQKSEWTSDDLQPAWRTDLSCKYERNASSQTHKPTWPSLQTDRHFYISHLLRWSV